MKCVKCGTLLPAGSNFCDKCGAKQKEETKCSCGRILEKDFKFCPECGKSLAKRTSADKKTEELKLKNAKIEGMKEAFEFISENGIDLDNEDIPLLVLASENSDAELAEALLKAGAYVNAQDLDQNTALHKACENGSNEIVKLLLENNADVELENDYGETPLSLARENGKKYIVGLLHKSGAEDDNDDDFISSGNHNLGFLELLRGKKQ